MEQKTVISDIQIVDLQASGLYGAAEGVAHKKIMPCLSVVQALHGEYEIKLGDGAWAKTGEGGAFIAPADVTQEIVHRDGKDGYMEAHWVFIDAIVNGKYRLDELFAFPVLLDKKYEAEVARLIACVRRPADYFEKIRAAYRLLEILVQTGWPRERMHPVRTKIETFVKEHYAEPIKAKDLAAHLFCSEAQAFRFVRKYYGLTPAHYVNGIRLQQAEILLRTTDKTVTEIAFSVGFSDSAYFSKLFKRFYADSPAAYRKKYGAFA